MEDFLTDISRSTGIYEFMSTPWGWPVIESVHFVGLSLLIGTIGIFDLRMLGLFKSIPLSGLHRLAPIGVYGFMLNVCSGFMFLSTMPDQYLYNPAFRMKMLFIMVAGINMLLFYRYVDKAVLHTNDDVDTVSKAKWFALISLLCWVLVILCGRLITFYRPPFYWCFFCC